MATGLVPCPGDPDHALGVEVRAAQPAIAESHSRTMRAMASPQPKVGLSAYSRYIAARQRWYADVVADPDLDVEASYRTRFAPTGHRREDGSWALLPLAKDGLDDPYDT